MKAFSLILLFCGLFKMISFGQQADTTIYIAPEIRPTFQYDTCTSEGSALRSYFRDHYKMPRILIDNGYVGKIIVGFIIEKDGSLNYINIILGIDKPLDLSIIKFLKTMPKWIPGINNGEAIRTSYILAVPIRWLYGY